MQTPFSVVGDQTGNARMRLAGANTPQALYLRLFREKVWGRGRGKGGKEKGTREGKEGGRRK